MDASDENQDKEKKVIGTPFTSENQPSPEAKSKGAKKAWAYKHARKDMYEALLDIKLPNGSSINFWEESMMRIRNATLSETQEVNIDDFFSFLEKKKKDGRKWVTQSDLDDYLKLTGLLTKKEKLEFILKLYREFLPKDVQIKGKIDIPLNIIISEDDSKY